MNTGFSTTEYTKYTNGRASCQERLPDSAGLAIFHFHEQQKA